MYLKLLNMLLKKVKIIGKDIFIRYIVDYSIFQCGLCKFYNPLRGMCKKFPKICKSFDLEIDKYGYYAPKEII